METAHKTEEEKREFFDSDEVLDKKVDQFVEMIKKSKHFIAFTGAGISTSAGIPDFRSGINTVLPTGPGCWEKLATKQNSNKKVIKTSMLQAIPTKCHMALVELERKGFLKYLVSQNVDGLHRRSGFDVDKLAELHGNTNLEICGRCKKKYMRDFRCRTALKVLEHKTTRKCDDPACRGDLFDSIINFGESLPEKELDESFDHAKDADLCLAMGSSLRVTPAANIPELVVMEKLGLIIPDFVLTRRLRVTRTTINKKEGVFFQGIDKDNCPYTIYKSVTVENNKIEKMLEKEPFFYSDPGLNFEKNAALNVTLNFQGHYGEPKIKIPIMLQSLKPGKEIKFLLEYSPKLNQWINCLEMQ